MTNETSPFDSAEEKAEWEETHFGTENEDDAYDRVRQEELDEYVQAFNVWLDRAGLESRKDNQESITLLRNAFFAGASYGVDASRKIYNAR